MQTTVFRSALLAAAIGFSSLAFAAGAQTTATTTEPVPASSTWMAHGMHHGMQHRMGDHHDRMDMMSELDLTATQRASIQQMMRDEHNRSRSQMKDLMQKRMAFENATPGSAGYQTAADQLAQAEAQAAQERVTRQAEMRTKIYEQLTPQQRTKLASLRSEHRAMMQKRRDQRARRAVHKAAEAAPAGSAGQQQ